MHIKKKEGFYYLIHSYRDGGIKNYEKYLGKQKPNSNDIENFLYEFTQLRWGKILQQYQSSYLNNLEKFPTRLNEQNLRAFGIRFTHNTNKIEGSTLSEGDTRLILEYDQVPANSNVNDVIETKSHMRVYEDMIKMNNPLSLKLLCDWHYNLFSLTKPSIAGCIRNGPIFIGGSNYVPPPTRDEVDLLLQELLEWYNASTKIFNPVFIAAIMHLRLVSIHPFEDGNGRITRLLMNYILHQNHYPMYDLDPKYRKGYYNALEKSNLRSDEMYFISWFFPRYTHYTRTTLLKLGFI